MTKFIPGDTVMLKSGGPCMTIDSVRDNGDLLCFWFTKDVDGRYYDKPSLAAFAPAALVEQEPEL